MNPHGTSRREFLQQAAAVGSAALLPLRAAADEKTVLERRQPQGLKLSCSSLAFSDMKWHEALAKVKELGFRYAELAMCEGWAHTFPSLLTDPEAHGKEIAATCMKLDIEPIAIHANFVLGDPKKFPGLTTPDAAARKTVLAQFERVVSCARTAEIPLISVLPGKFIDDVPRENGFKSSIDMLTQMHGIAARRGLLLSIETPTGSIAEQPDDTKRLLEGVPGLRLDYSPSHFVAHSISLEQTRDLMKYVSHVSVRNAKTGSDDEPIADGKLDFPLKSCLDGLRGLNVNAYVSVAYFKPERRNQIAALKTILEGEGVAVR